MLSTPSPLQLMTAANPKVELLKSRLGDKAKRQKILHAMHERVKEFTKDKPEVKKEATPADINQQLGSFKVRYKLGSRVFCYLRGLLGGVGL